MRVRKAMLRGARRAPDLARFAEERLDALLGGGVALAHKELASLPAVEDESLLVHRVALLTMPPSQSQSSHELACTAGSTCSTSRRPGRVPVTAPLAPALAGPWVVGTTKV